MPAIIAARVNEHSGIRAELVHYSGEPYARAARQGIGNKTGTT
jgi:hypothetical protein